MARLWRWPVIYFEKIPRRIVSSLQMSMLRTYPGRCPARSCRTICRICMRNCPASCGTRCCPRCRSSRIRPRLNQTKWCIEITIRYTGCPKKKYTLCILGNHQLTAKWNYSKIGHIVEELICYILLSGRFIKLGRFSAEGAKPKSFQSLICLTNSKTNNSHIRYWIAATLQAAYQYVPSYCR